MNKFLCRLFGCKRYEAFEDGHMKYQPLFRYIKNKRTIEIGGWKCYRCGKDHYFAGPPVRHRVS